MNSFPKWDCCCLHSLPCHGDETKRWAGGGYDFPHRALYGERDAFLVTIRFLLLSLAKPGESVYFTPMIQLGVNIDHVATLRQARQTYEPDPVWAAAQAQLAGADGITVHLREDRRHIQDRDVLGIMQMCHVKLNLEMAATEEMLGFACEVKPSLAMLVPEGRHEITTEGGLDVAGQVSDLSVCVNRLSDAGITASAFIDAQEDQIRAAKRAGFSVCEIHTGPYAHAFHTFNQDLKHPRVLGELEKVGAAGRLIQELGMKFNAGHALNYLNVQPIAQLPGICELHIGHAIISRAIFAGLGAAVAEMKRLISDAGRH